MRVDVVLLPRDLRPEHVEGRTVVVFDVLRATTSMAVALSMGAKEVRIFPDIPTAEFAHKNYTGPSLLCGEKDALPPPGFDLGNSPPAFTAENCSGRTVFVSTTNGTRAIIAAQGAEAIFIGALVNASAVARAASGRGLHLTLLCSGTNGQVAMEDLTGCGAVIDAISSQRPLIADSDLATIARRVFHSARSDLASALRETRGGQNVMGAGLGTDIDFAARLDSIDIVGRVIGDPPRVVRDSVTL